MAKQISLTRIRRVDYFVQRDTRFATTETVAYTKGRDSLPVNANSYKVAEAISQGGIDAMQLSKKDIIGWAEFVILNQGSPKVAAPIATAASEPTSARQEEKPEPLAPLIDMPVRVAIYTLLLSALELSHYDMRSGNTALSTKLETVTKEYGEAIHPVTARPSVESVPTSTESESESEENPEETEAEPPSVPTLI